VAAREAQQAVGVQAHGVDDEPLELLPRQLAPGGRLGGCCVFHDAALPRIAVRPFSRGAGFRRRSPAERFLDAEMCANCEEIAPLGAPVMPPSAAQRCGRCWGSDTTGC